MQHKTSLAIIEQNISYYNDIAPQYNTMVDKDSDKSVRQKVADKFLNICKNATVLDFGGGTGLDLEWLSESNFKIFICEPSKAMREIAIAKNKILANQNVIFLDDAATDFRQWNHVLPFEEKANAVLANFAVLNCIPDIELLFSRLALIIKPQANIIALALTKDLKKLCRTNFKSFFRSFIYNEPLSINIQYQNHQQTVYIYSVPEIIKASKNDFIFCSSERLHSSDFTLIHLMRK
ncbi:MAG: class I SAM-dependent methyltransferase [Ginsengibacter sp.]